jgi:hypothetical protein
VANPVALGVVLVGVGGAVVVRVAGGYLSRPWPRAHDVVQQYGLWAALPIILVYLLVVAWPIALVGLVVAPLLVVVLRSLDLPYGIPRARPRPRP